MTTKAAGIDACLPAVEGTLLAVSPNIFFESTDAHHEAFCTVRRRGVVVLLNVTRAINAKASAIAVITRQPAGADFVVLPKENGGAERCQADEDCCDERLHGGSPQPRPATFVGLY